MQEIMMNQEIRYHIMNHLLIISLLEKEIFKIE
jgi:hypothetical protein